MPNHGPANTCYAIAPLRGGVGRRRGAASFNKRMERNGLPALSSNDPPQFQSLSCIERALPVSRA